MVAFNHPRTPKVVWRSFVNNTTMEVIITNSSKMVQPAGTIYMPLQQAPSIGSTSLLESYGFKVKVIQECSNE
jgi:tRNA1(Val) A37 N6-methylase TrmN6